MRPSFIRMGFLLFLVLALLAGCVGFPQNRISLQSDGTWMATLELPAGGLPEDLPGLASRLSAEGILASWSQTAADLATGGYRLELSGVGGTGQVRALIYGGMADALQPLAADIELILVGWVKRDEAISISLEANPSTGYAWQFNPDSSSLVIQSGETQFIQKSALLGGTARQTLEFTGVADGKATIDLVYRRSWEQAPVTRFLQIQGPRLSDLADLTDPAQPPALETDEADAEAPVLAQAPSGSLPAVFDLRAQLTSIKDQRSCGSCWAFASVGTFESALKLHAGVTADLSEQYLVSCNKNGWGCNGGWTAHPYHYNVFGFQEATAGGVLEANFPYQAQDVPCGNPHSHPYQLTGWSYVGATPWHPTVAEIKQAIYTNGPVQTSVCVGPKFSAYKAGTVFATDESSVCSAGGATVNHAVVLVGWDDTKGPNGAWILRNSWGSGWGDHGYMLIDRTVSQIGYYTSEVTFPSLTRVFLPRITR